MVWQKVTGLAGCEHAGSLTIALAVAGHTVVGVDPNPEFLHHARSRPGADRMAWGRGTSSLLPDDNFDVALMTVNVAQEALLPTTSGHRCSQIKARPCSGWHPLLRYVRPGGSGWGALGFA